VLLVRLGPLQDETRNIVTDFQETLRRARSSAAAGMTVVCNAYDTRTNDARGVGADCRRRITPPLVSGGSEAVERTIPIGMSTWKWLPKSRPYFVFLADPFASIFRPSSNVRLGLPQAAGDRRRGFAGEAPPAKHLILRGPNLRSGMCGVALSGNVEIDNRRVARLRPTDTT